MDSTSAAFCVAIRLINHRDGELNTVRPDEEELAAAGITRRLELARDDHAYGSDRSPSWRRVSMGVRLDAARGRPASCQGELLRGHSAGGSVFTASSAGFRVGSLLIGVVSTRLDSRTFGDRQRRGSGALPFPHLRSFVPPRTADGCGRGGHSGWQPDRTGQCGRRGPVSRQPGRCIVAAETSRLERERPWLRYLPGR